MRRVSLLQNTYAGLLLSVTSHSKRISIYGGLKFLSRKNKSIIVNIFMCMTFFPTEIGKNIVKFVWYKLSCKSTLSENSKYVRTQPHGLGIFSKAENENIKRTLAVLVLKLFMADYCTKTPVDSGPR